MYPIIVSFKVWIVNLSLCKPIRHDCCTCNADLDPATHKDTWSITEFSLVVNSNSYTNADNMKFRCVSFFILRTHSILEDIPRTLAILLTVILESHTIQFIFLYVSTTLRSLATSLDSICCCPGFSWMWHNITTFTTVWATIWRIEAFFIFFKNSKIKRKLHTYTLVESNSHITKWRNRILRQAQPEAKLKSSRENIKFHSAFFTVWGTHWCAVNSKSLDSFIPLALLSVAHMPTWYFFCLDFHWCPQFPHHL